MTTTPERRTATLSELVAEEIRALMGRKRMSQAQLARGIGKTEMWVSLRLRGKQPIDMNDLHLIATALEAEAHDLLPPREVARTASTGLKDGKERVGRTDRHGRRTEPAQTGRQLASHIFGPSRPTSVRPVSAIPARRRRPTRTRPGERPIPA